MGGAYYVSFRNLWRAVVGDTPKACASWRHERCSSAKHHQARSFRFAAAMPPGHAPHDALWRTPPPRTTRGTYPYARTTSAPPPTPRALLKANPRSGTTAPRSHEGLHRNVVGDALPRRIRVTQCVAPSIHDVLYGVQPLDHLRARDVKRPTSGLTGRTQPRVASRPTMHRPIPVSRFR